MDAPRQYETVVVASAIDDHLRRDKQSLQAFRPRTLRVFNSGGDAAGYLGQQGVDIIILDSELGDMDGCKLMRIARKMTLHRKTPMIMITLDAQKDAVLEAIAAGCTGYVLRPYSAETLKRHLIMAEQLQRFSEIEMEQLQQAKELVQQGDFDDAIEEFEEILSLQDEAQKYYDMGCDYLIKLKYGKAIISFDKALKINDLFAEAYQGLAEAYKGKGDQEKYKAYLQKSAEIHAQFDRMEEAKAIFIEILRHDTKAPNPYNTLGVRLRRNGDYSGAVHAYKRALEITPLDENILFNLSKAFHYLGDRKEAQVRLTQALNINPDFPEAQRFYKETAGKSWAPSGIPASAQRQTPTPQTIKDI